MREKKGREREEGMKIDKTYRGEERKREKDIKKEKKEDDNEEKKGRERW